MELKSANKNIFNACLMERDQRRRNAHIIQRLDNE